MTLAENATEQNLTTDSLGNRLITPFA